MFEVLMTWLTIWPFEFTCTPWVSRLNYGYV